MTTKSVKKDCSDDQIKECEERFPTWKQFLITALSTVAGSVILIGSLAFIYAKQETIQDYSIKDMDSKITLNADAIKDHTMRLNRLETMSNNLDTIKTLLRNPKRYR